MGGRGEKQEEAKGKTEERGERREEDGAKRRGRHHLGEHRPQGLADGGEHVVVGEVVSIGGEILWHGERCLGRGRGGGEEGRRGGGGEERVTGNNGGREDRRQRGGREDRREDRREEEREEMQLANAAAWPFSELIPMASLE